MKKKLIFKISLLMLALLCAFGTLGAYTWAWDYNENEIEFVANGEAISNLSSFKYEENPGGSVEKSYFVIVYKDEINGDSISYMTLSDKSTNTYSVYMAIDGPFLDDVDDTYILNVENLNLQDFLIEYINEVSDVFARPSEAIYLINGIEETNDATFTSSIFETLAAIITSFTGLLGTLFVSVANIFYSNNQLTIIGILTLVSVATALCLWGFKYIKRLIKVRTK